MKRYRSLLVVICLLVIVASGCSASSKVRNPLNWKVEPFQYMNQNGQSFGIDNLKGKVTVADFFFTSCQTVCPPMTANLVRLQNMAKEEKLDVQFVSFSVDPEVDTPDAIRTFVSTYTNDTSNWNLLTGYKQADIQNLAQTSFRTVVDKPSGSTQVTHGTNFYLIDRTGTIVKKYSGYSNVPYENIIHDIKLLSK
ncbi:SCO family protein [Ectobacillus polymachus]|uniref:SCO family protein n=1 Tax=Ectobacillus polymachus TaxID=1508806 RepID=UPI003A88617E